MKTLLIVIEALASLALIVVVLLQSGKEAGLSGFFHQVDRHCLGRADAGPQPGWMIIRIF